MWLTFIGILCIAHNGYTIFEHDRAAYAAQQEHWPEAIAHIKHAVVDHPNDPTVLYDAGVASYRVRDFKQAVAYFGQAASIQDVATGIQEAAYYNQGNAHAHLKKYKEAIANYEAVLKLNPDHQHAKENLELVKQLLIQDEQNQQSQKNDQQNNDSQKDKDGNDESDRQQEDDQEGSDSEGESGKSKQDSQDTRESSGKNKNDDNDQRDDASDQDGQSKNDGQSPTEKQQKPGQERQSSPDNKDDQSQEQQASTPSSEESGKETQSLEPQPQQVAPWLDKILSEREKQDVNLNKKMIQKQAAQQGKGDSHERAGW